MIALSPARCPKVSLNPLKCVEVRRPIKTYTGYRVITSTTNELPTLVSRLGPSVVVNTSKNGVDYSDMELRKRFVLEVLRKGGLTLLFGTPRRDFNEVVDNNVVRKLGVKYTLNFIPGQGTLTVRTTEALHAVLSQVNSDIAMFSKGSKAK